MIHAVIVMNTHGKPRITKFYKNVVFSLNNQVSTENDTFLPIRWELSLVLLSVISIFNRVYNVSKIVQRAGKAADEQQEIVSAIYSALSSKGENFCSFIEADDIFGPETQLVYKHFATLYFVFAIDKAENELAILDLIQLFVEVLDKAFKNVCELDIVYNFNKATSPYLNWQPKDWQIRCQHLQSLVLVSHKAIYESFGARSKHYSSNKVCSNKPVLRGPCAKPGKESLSQAHISQCELAGTIYDLQVYGSVRNIFASHSKESISKRKAGEAESAGVQHQETTKVSDMSEGRRDGDEDTVMKREEAVGGSQGGDSMDSEQASQDLVSSLSTKHSLDSISPLFSFGVITDVQYADIPNGRSFLGTPRFYRHALEVLNRAVANWNHLGRLDFAIHFGDLVDGLSKHESHVAFEKVLAEFNAFRGGSVYHMIGNHCLYNLPRAELNKLLKIPPSSDERSYYEFSPHPGFRFVVLDGYDISVLGWPKEHPNAQMATRLLHRINPNEDKNSPRGLKGDMARFVMFNGGLGNDQLSWLDHVLHKANVSNEKIIICCHLPLHPGTVESPSALCWNYVDVLVTLQKYSCVVACLSGHAHTGGYIMDSHGIHYVVLEAVLECPPGDDAFGVVDVFPDRLSLTGKGRLTSREIYFRRESSI